MMNFFENAVFVSAKTNDLVTALCALGYEPLLADDALCGMDMLSENGALFILANDYPKSGTALTEELLSRARDKHVKIYIEYPESVLGIQTEEPRGILYERIVITQELCGLEKDSILTLNGCKYRRFLGKERAIVALAKIAGYDKLAYGMPEEWETMLGYLDEQEDVLVASTALTNFITARHAPKIRWKALWQGILSLMGAEDIPFDYEESVTIVADKNEPLSDHAADEAVQRNIQWIKDYMIDDSLGVPRVVEGFGSAIDENGNQQPRMVFRGDCTGEIAMTLSQGAKMLQDESLAELTEGIMDRFFTPEVFYNDDPRSSAYGHTNWFENAKIFYGDDNARAILGAISARAISGETRWDDKILHVIFANLRTSDQYGVRSPRIDIENFKDKTWLDFYNGTVDYISPHYQASLYALFLWAYQLTGIRELFDKSVSAIGKTMELFPHKLRWQNGLTGEITRMLLPLSILVRIDPSEKHVKWLRDAVDATVALQEPCGAIREVIGDLSLGKYPPPSSNERYGTAEASLLQSNGDPATDLLYSINWAFIGLWEAYLALGDESIKKAYLSLKDFLLRIQLCSKKHPEIDGAWMRSFDFDKWEYWGSSADIGWAACSIESGWTNAWITTTLILESKNESLFDLSPRENFSKIAPAIYEEMMTFTATYDDGNEKVETMEGSAE